MRTPALLSRSSFGSQLTPISSGLDAVSAGLEKFAKLLTGKHRACSLKPRPWSAGRRGLRRLRAGKHSQHLDRGCPQARERAKIWLARQQAPPRRWARSRRRSLPKAQHRAACSGLMKKTPPICPRLVPSRSLGIFCHPASHRRILPLPRPRRRASRASAISAQTSSSAGKVLLLRLAGSFRARASNC